MCDACERAQINPHDGLFHDGCKHCRARMLAHGPAYWESERAGKLEPSYRALLQRTFGADWQQWHEVVKGWAKRIRSKQ